MPEKLLSTFFILTQMIMSSGKFMKFLTMSSKNLGKKLSFWSKRRQNMRNSKPKEQII